MFLSLIMCAGDCACRYAFFKCFLSSLSVSISIIYLPSGTRGVVAQSPEPGAHDKSD